MVKIALSIYDLRISHASYRDMDTYTGKKVLSPVVFDRDDDSKKICLSKRQGKQKIQSYECSEIPKNTAESKIGKVKRHTWSATAVELFFEGLYQHGKDFPKILDYMLTRQRKMNNFIISGLTKNQVRFFYYRTWHKVELLLNDPSSLADKKGKSIQSSIEDVTQPVEFCNDSALEDGDIHLDSSVDETEELLSLSPRKTTDMECISEDVSYSPPNIDSDRTQYIMEKNLDVSSSYKGDKRKDSLIVNGIRHSLDLVALICYWRLKKKYPAGEHSFARKLSELVYLGATTIPGRVKGKRRSQLKIPSCGAFRINTNNQLEKPLLSYDVNQPVKSSSPNAEVMDLSDYDSVSSFMESLHITVELRPLTAATWIIFQNLALNPRMRIFVDTSKTIETLVQVLSGRLSLNSTYTVSLHPNNKLFTDEDISEPGVFCSDEDDYEVEEGIHPDVSLSELYIKIGCSSTLKLFYHITESEDNQDESQNLHNLVKLVDVLKPDELYYKKKKYSTPVKRQPRVHSSPKVKEYLRSLPSISIRKSPLSKYRQSPKRNKMQDIRSKSRDRDLFIMDNRLNGDDMCTSFVTSLKPFSKSRRPKKKVIKTGHMRKLVPKPLHFLPENHSASKNTFIPISVKHIENEGDQNPLRNSNSRDKGEYLLSNVVVEEDIQGAVVQNFLSEKQTDSEDENTQKLYTSSDTVNELLRGLSAIKPDTAILKLSEETADVLPTFSRVLDDSSTLIDRVNCSRLRDNPNEVKESISSSRTEIEAHCTSVFEDSSLDYIKKFRELASSMEEEWT